MRRLFWHWIISSVALLLAAAALNKGVHLGSWVTALWLAPLLGLVNALVGGITTFISLIALPITVLTLGCFGFVLSFVLYAVAIWLLSTALVAFQVDNIWWAMALAAVMALFSSVLNMLLPGDKRVR